MHCVKKDIINASFYHNDMIIISSPSSIQLSAVECLSYTGVQIDLYNLFAVTPMFRQLDARPREPFHGDIVCVPPMFLRRLSIDIFRATIAEIRHLLLSMTSLTDLTLNISMVQTDKTDGNA
jgi:hypothetical protein